MMGGAAIYPEKSKKMTERKAREWCAVNSDFAGSNAKINICQIVRHFCARLITTNLQHLDVFSAL